MRTHIAPVALALSVAVAAAAVAQAPQRLLSDGDVKKFIRDFKPMATELERLGVEAAPDVDNVGGFSAIISGMQASAEAQSILRKYGWSDATFQKFAAVLSCYFVLKLEQVRAENEPEIKAQLAEIDGNAQLSAAQKAELKVQISAMLDQFAQLERSYRAQIHPDDINAVKGNLEALEQLFEE